MGGHGAEHSAGIIGTRSVRGGEHRYDRDRNTNGRRLPADIPGPVITADVRSAGLLMETVMS